MPRISRRRLQFSLRSLFFVVTVCAIGVGWRVDRARNQHHIVAALGTDCFVIYDYEMDASDSRIPDATPWAPQWLVRSVGIDFFADVVGATIGSGGIEDCRLLGRLPALRHVEIWGRIDPWESIEQLAGIRSLTVIDSGPVRDPDLKSIGRIKSLESLCLGTGCATAPGFTDGGLKHLETLQRLRTLEFSGLNQLTISGIQQLSNALPNCKIRYRPGLYASVRSSNWIDFASKDAN